MSERPNVGPEVDGGAGKNRLDEGAVKVRVLLSQPVVVLVVVLIESWRPKGEGSYETDKKVRKGEIKPRRTAGECRQPIKVLVCEQTVRQGVIGAVVEPGGGGLALPIRQTDIDGGK
jgi:hypothetical protein